MTTKIDPLNENYLKIKTKEIKIKKIIKSVETSVLKNYKGKLLDIYV